ncbi:MAG: hypothetical protein COA84_16140 [Robiginitomaculum sp.]|nr:MAG: hypothetical protein COA84_16140 [Robiginitomaculum sp.]
MILRRVIKHFHNQEWTAIFLDFLIVVVGVFVGLQVQNWNDSRQEVVQEQKYYHRLHTEIVKGLDETRAAFTFQQVQRQNLNGALEAFREASEIRHLSDGQCASIYFSHIYEDAFIPLPTVTELLASGQLSILKKDDLRALLIAHFLALKGWEDGVDGLQADRAVMTSRYADLIRLGVEFSNWSFVQQTFIDNGSMRGKIHCNLAGMRANNRFKNDLFDNSSRQESYFESLKLQQEALHSIHAKLDDVLRISHGKEVKP